MLFLGKRLKERAIRTRRSGKRTCGRRCVYGEDVKAPFTASRTYLPSALSPRR